MAKDSRRPTGYRTQCGVCRQGYDWSHSYKIRSRKYRLPAVVECFTPADLVDRHGDRCVYCPDGAFECIDHVVCVRAGGTHTLDNVVPCCVSCNTAKYWVVDQPLIRRFDELRAQTVVAP
ncbi:HNH endonuclease [Mycolicibacterium diernhoferi]|nr:HNH endonuclease [Mycolicibacterium diernhoferi]